MILDIYLYFLSKRFQYIGIEKYRAIYKYIQLQGNRNGHKDYSGAHTPSFMTFITFPITIGWDFLWCAHLFRFSCHYPQNLSYVIFAKIACWKFRKKECIKMIENKYIKGQSYGV